MSSTFCKQFNKILPTHASGPVYVRLRWTNPIPKHIISSLGKCLVSIRPCHSLLVYAKAMLFATFLVIHHPLPFFRPSPCLWLVYRKNWSFHATICSKFKPSREMISLEKERKRSTISLLWNIMQAWNIHRSGDGEKLPQEKKEH